MKQEAEKRMQRVKRNYKGNEKKFKAEEKRLCDLQHEEYLKFYDVFRKRTSKNEYHPHGGALQTDDKGKIHHFDYGKDYVIYEPTVEQLCCLLTHIYKSMRYRIVCDDEVIKFVHKRRKSFRRIFL